MSGQRSARGLMIATSATTAIACLGMLVVQEASRAGVVGQALVGAGFLLVCGFYSGQLWHVASERDGQSSEARDEATVPLARRPRAFQQPTREHRSDAVQAS